MTYHYLVDNLQADIIEDKLVSLLQLHIANTHKEAEVELETLEEHNDIGKVANSNVPQAHLSQEIVGQRYDYHKLPDWPEGARVLLYLSDDQLIDILSVVVAKKWQIAILPHPEARIAVKAYGVSTNLDYAILDAVNNEVMELDLLLCNDRPVLYSLVIGHVFGLRPGGSVEGLWNRWKYLAHSIKRVGQLVPQRFVLETHNAEKITTAAIGITVVEHGQNSVLGRRLLPDSSASDGKFHCILLAPRSVMEMIIVLLQSLFSKGKGDLPQCVGMIETASLNVECAKGLQYRHDNVDICAKKLSFSCEQKMLKMVAGRNILVGKTRSNPKERRRIQYLPSGDAINELTAKPLRWMAHAATEDFKELYQTLRENAMPSSVFLTLMILATMLASVGLFANSPPVIIGAMILAPLMAPIISLSMAILRQDGALLKNSAKTLLTGLLLALFFAVLVALVVPIDSVTHEIAVRIHPNLLDLAVAVISGIAGAYATAKASVSKSLAGVAIAVALVPPLAVTGIGIGWGDFSLIGGAFLLFVTNMAGIVLSAALTFLVLGFAPFHLAKRGLIWSLAVVAGVSIPLAFSFMIMVKQSDLIQKIEHLSFNHMRIENVSINGSKPLILSFDAISDTQLQPKDYGTLKTRIEAAVQQPVVLEIRPVLRLD